MFGATLGAYGVSKAVFTYKAASIYDDNPEIRYHFPHMYLRQAESAVGDLIVYYEPRRTGIGDIGGTGRRSYVAVAKVERVDRDPIRSDHYYAYIEKGSYLTFDRPVPFRENTLYYERSLRREDGKTNKGAFRRSVRLLSNEEFENILSAGFSRPLLSSEDEWDLPELAITPGASEEQAIFERPVVERVLSRPVRDAVFTRTVREAYDSTCAVTGLKLTNGRGRPEVQAAHIRPVEHHGPDSVRNGIALCGTLHWMFDRGLIAVGPPPNFDLLFTQKGLPDEVLRMINPERRLRVPDSPLFQPAPIFLDFHRSVIFDHSD